ncbi:MAG: DMT family transporter [Ruminococcaceae bacterium]|nr:DMT family transporter [Oscillospiraceae bacterium]
MELWVIFVLLYGIFKGAREPIKKKVLEKHDLLSALFAYTFIGFLMTVPMAHDVFSIDAKTFILIGVKSFVLFFAWLATFAAVKKLSVSFYSVMDLSRVVFSTLMGVIFLNESLTLKGIISLAIVVTGLYLVNRQKDSVEKTTDGRYVWLVLCSCLLNAVSGILDKYIMSHRAVSSIQLQFWFMLMLSAMYFIYIHIKGEKLDVRGCAKNPYIYILSFLLVVGDRLLFMANSYESSQVTVMTLIKQSAVIVAILSGKFVYGEKIARKLWCAGIIIFGIVLAVI